MIKSFNFPSHTRIASLLCCSAAVLLTACGGGEPVDAGQPRAAGTAGLMVSSAGAPAQPAATLAQGVEMNQAAPVAVGQAKASSEADFALAGYEGGPFAGDDSSQSSAQMTASGSAIAALPGGSVSPAYVVPATTYKLYVSPNGNDASAGTASAPFRTLARAARSTRASMTVFVAPGTYTGGLRTTIHGSASGKIYYVSTTKHGAIIRPSGSANFAWDNRGHHVEIIGFRVNGAGGPWKNGIYNGGSYDVIKGNWVHDIAKGVGCTSAGGSAIGIDSYYRGVKSDAIGNLVHDIGPAGCRYIQGIYMSTSGQVKNNVVYRVAEGAIHLWHDANNVIITNNTVTTSHTGIIVGGGDYYHTSGPSNYNRVYNNIVYDNAMGISEQGRTGTSNTYRNNLVFQNSTYNWRLFNGLSHSGTVTSAPYFVAYSRTGTPNLRLTSSSPAIGRGTSTDALSYDYLERARNTSTGFDIGAYQH